MLRPISLTFLTLAPLLAVGCGSPQEVASPETSPAPVLYACSLFTEADARAIAGDAIAGTASSTLDDAVGRDPAICVYNSGSTQGGWQLSLQVRQFPDPERAARMQSGSESSLRRLARGRFQEVAGVGDGAVWAGGDIQQLHVLSGNTQLVITVKSPDKADQIEAAKGVAAKALTRMEAAGEPG